MGRLTPQDLACWGLRTSSPPAEIAPGWRPGTDRELVRCVRPSYRLDLIAAGAPCRLCLGGRDRPGVPAGGELTGPPGSGDDGPVVRVRFPLLPEPVERGA